MNKLKEYIKVNEKFWTQKPINESRKDSIYIPEELGLNTNLFSSDIVRYICAKAIQEKTGYEIIRFLHKKDDLKKKKIADSFGIKTVVLQDKKRNGYIYVLSYMHMLRCMLLYRTGERLLDYKIDGISLGKDIYDRIIRVQERNTIDKLCYKDISSIYEGILLYYQVKRLYKEKRPKYILLGELAYYYGIYRAVAQKMGAKIIIASVYLREGNVEGLTGYIAKSDGILVHEGWETLKNTDYHLYMQNYFKRYFNGDSELSWIKSINKDKKKIKIEEVRDQLNLSPNKKNVFIYAHALSDAPHCSEKMLYKDYYSALKETMAIASKIDNINWILKIHPSFRNFSGANGTELLKEYSNIVLFGDEYSNDVVFEMADAIITVQGTIGIEASSLGIPVVITGKAWYSEYGFTINAFTQKKYERVMENLYKIKRLSADKVDMAQKIFCAYLLGYNITSIDKDEFGKTIFDNMLSKKPIRQKDEFIVDYVTDYMQNYSIKDTYIYKKSVDLAVDL